MSHIVINWILLLKVRPLYVFISIVEVTLPLKIVVTHVNNICYYEIMLQTLLFKMIIFVTEHFLFTVKLSIFPSAQQNGGIYSLRNAEIVSIHQRVKDKKLFTIITFATRIISPSLQAAHWYWTFSTIQRMYIMYMANKEILSSFVKLISANNPLNIVLHSMVNRKKLTSNNY